MSEEIPTARPAHSGPEGALQDAPAPTLEPKPILELAEDSCPKCGGPVGAERTICAKCGYDFVTNQVPVVPAVQMVAAAEAHAKAAEVGAEGEFVLPGRGSTKTLAIVGSVLTVCAMVAAGIGTPKGAGGLLVVATVLLAVYNVLVHACTGTAAVAVAARITGERFTLSELPLARMFVAYALFEFCRSVHLPLGIRFFEFLIAWGIGIGAYLGAVWWLFRRDRDVTLLIAGCHAGIWVLLQAGMELSRWAAASAALLPVK